MINYRALVAKAVARRSYLYVSIPESVVCLLPLYSNGLKNNELLCADSNYLSLVGSFKPAPKFVWALPLIQMRY